MSRSQPIRKPQIKRDGSTAPRTQLKQCTPQQRAWAWELGQTMSGEQARRAIKDELGIWLGSDSAYSAFRQWQFRQAQWDYLDEMATQDELNMKDVCPGISREMLREQKGWVSGILGDLDVMKWAITDDGEIKRRQI